MSTILTDEQVERAAVVEADMQFEALPADHPDRASDSQLKLLWNVGAIGTGDGQFRPDDPRLTDKWFVSALINRRISNRNAEKHDPEQVFAEMANRTSRVGS